MLSTFANKKNKLIFLGSISIGVVFIIAWLFFARSYEFTDNAYLKADIVIIKSKVAGYLTKVYVNDNQMVKEGQILAQIDDKDYRLKLLQAQENVRIAKSKVNALVHKIHIQNYEVNALSFAKDTARTNLDKANKDLNRAKALIKDHAISQAHLDEVFALHKAAANAFSIAKTNYESGRHKQEISNLEFEEAKAELKGSEAQLDLAGIDLENTKIIAATDGRVSKKALQVGQLVSPNIALGYLVQNNIWVVANFKEVQTGKMHFNQEAIVTIDSFPGVKFKARVQSISPATGAEFSILPPENATGNFTKIVQRVPVRLVFEKNQDLSSLRTGLSCEVKVYR